MDTTTIIPLQTTEIIQRQREMAQKLVAGQASLLLSVKQIEVVDDESYAQCVAIRNAAADGEKRIVAAWRDLCETANDLHKSATSARAEMAKPFVTVKEMATAKAEAYLREQRAAAKALEESLRRVAMAQQKETQKMADIAMAQGYVEEAEVLNRQAELTTIPALPNPIPKVAGAKITPVWRTEIIDMIAFLKDIVDGKQPLMWEYRGEQRPIVTVDQAVLAEAVKRRGDELTWKGLRIYDDLKLSTGPKERR